MWKKLMTGTWKGPDALISSGRGYAYVFPQDADSPVWIPDWLVRLVAVGGKENERRRDGRLK